VAILKAKAENFSSFGPLVISSSVPFLVPLIGGTSTGEGKNLPQHLIIFLLLLFCHHQLKLEKINSNNCLSN